MLLSELEAGSTELCADSHKTAMDGWSGAPMSDVSGSECLL